MSLNSIWKSISIACISFVLGVFSFYVSASIFDLSMKVQRESVKVDQDQAKLIPKGKKQLNCTPVDTNLKYEYIKENDKNLPEIRDSIIELSEIMRKMLKIEEQLIDEKEMSGENRNKLEKRLEELERKHRQLFNKTVSKPDALHDLLYREYCDKVE